MVCLDFGKNMVTRQQVNVLLAADTSCFMPVISDDLDAE